MMPFIIKDHNEYRYINTFDKYIHKIKENKKYNQIIPNICMILDEEYDNPNIKANEIIMIMKNAIVLNCSKNMIPYIIKYVDISGQKTIIKYAIDANNEDFIYTYLKSPSAKLSYNDIISLKNET